MFEIGNIFVIVGVILILFSLNRMDKKKRIKYEDKDSYKERRKQRNAQD